MPLHVACKSEDANKHEYDVNYLLFHQGKLYSAADEGKIKIWSADLKQLDEIEAHPCSVFCIAASNDTLFSCSNEGTVKSWTLQDPHQTESILVKDEAKEFWRVKYSDGILYSGDDQGSIKVFKNGNKLFGEIDVVVPVKDMLIHKNLLITSKDNDVVVTELLLEGTKPQFILKATIAGRGPLGVVDDKLIITSQDGKGLIVNPIGKESQQSIKIENAHEMIINGLDAKNCDGNPIIFTGGWDKVVKKWRIESGIIKQEETCNVDNVVNALICGEQGQIYVGTADGHILRLDC